MDTKKIMGKREGDILNFEFIIPKGAKLVRTICAGKSPYKFDKIRFFIGDSTEEILLSDCDWEFFKIICCSINHEHPLVFDMINSIYWPESTRESAENTINLYPGKQKRFEILKPSEDFEFYITCVKIS